MNRFIAYSTLRGFAIKLPKQHDNYLYTNHGNYRVSLLCTQFLDRQKRSCKNVRLRGEEHCHLHQAKLRPAIDPEYLDQSCNPLRWEVQDDHDYEDTGL